MKNLILFFLFVYTVASCGDNSKSTALPADKETIQSKDSAESEVNKGNAVNLGLGQDQGAHDKIDDRTKKLHEFADNKCKCGQLALKGVGEIDKLTEEETKEFRTKYKNCIGEFRTGEIIKIMDKKIVDSYMIQNCPQISSTFNRIKNRF